MRGTLYLEVDYSSTLFDLLFDYKRGSQQPTDLSHYFASTMFAIGENSVGTSDHLLSDHLGDEATLYMLQTMVRALLHSKPQINSLT